MKVGKVTRCLGGVVQLYMYMYLPWPFVSPLSFLQSLGLQCATSMIIHVGPLPPNASQAYYAICCSPKVNRPFSLLHALCMCNILERLLYTVAGMLGLFPGICNHALADATYHSCTCTCTCTCACTSCTGYIWHATKTKVHVFCTCTYTDKM